MMFTSRLMKISILMCALIAAISLSAHAGTSAQEKAFLDKYKTAFEAKDTAALESFLYAKAPTQRFSVLQNDAVKRSRGKNLQDRPCRSYT